MCNDSGGILGIVNVLMRMYYWFYAYCKCAVLPGSPFQSTFRAGNQFHSRSSSTNSAPLNTILPTLDGQYLYTIFAPCECSVLIVSSYLLFSLLPNITAMAQTLKTVLRQHPGESGISLLLTLGRAAPYFKVNNSTRAFRLQYFPRTRDTDSNVHP